MPEFITIPIETDPDELSGDAIEYIQTVFPEWDPNDGNLDVITLLAHARIAAEARDVASDVPVSIFRYFGDRVMNIHPIDATAATVDSTWTMVDDAGYTIPAGTTVGIPAAGDDLQGFTVEADVTVSPGETATGAGEVVLIAEEAGAAASGLDSEPELVDALEYVEAIALVGATSGGTDAEEDEDYLNRLATELQLMTPRPIVPRDFEVLVRRIGGVARSTAIDGYNPITEEEDEERTISVAIADEEGQPLAAGIKDEADALLQSLREVNFLVFIIDPTYTEVAVTTTVRAYSGFDLDDVDARVVSALNDYLNPATWGSVPGAVEADEWHNDTKVRYLEVAAVINQVDGVNYIDSLTIGEEGGAMGSADVTIDGYAPLAEPGTIAVTVNAP